MRGKLESLEKFLDLLYDGQTGWVYSPIKPKATSEWFTRWFHWPGDRSLLAAWIGSNSLSGDVYLAPSLFREKSAKKDSVLGAQVVWCEFDGVNQEHLENMPKPAAVVKSSSDDHLHVYWRVPFLNGETIENINRRLTYFLEADSSGWDSTQVLRPPGTLNHKYIPERQVSLVLFNVLSPKLEPQFFDKIPEPPTYIHIEDIEGLPSLEQVLTSYSIPKKARELFNKLTVEKGLRSSHLMQVGYEFAAVGLKHNELMTILLAVDDKIGKFIGRQDRLVRLSEVASIAVAKYGIAMKVPYYSPLELLALDVHFESHWGKYLPATGNLMITGAPGVGKSQLAFQLAMSMASGRAVLGEQPTQLKTCYFSFEMPVIGMKWLLSMQLAAFTPEEKKMMNENLIIYPLGYPMDLPAMEKSIQEHVARGFFVDSMSTLAEDALIDEKEVSRILNWDNRTRQLANIFSVFIHHNRKENGERRPARLSDVYGSYLFGARFDSVICLWRDTGKASNPKLTEGTKFIELKTRYGLETMFDIERTQHLHWQIKVAEILEKKTEEIIQVEEKPSGKLGL